MKKYSFIFRLLLIIAVGILSMISANAQLLTNDGDTIYISNNETLYIPGGLKNIDNGTNYPFIVNNGVLNITGDLVKSVNTNYTGLDSLLITGSGVQSIAGMNFHYMGITGGGIKILTDNSKISDHLNITNGVLNTNVYTLTLDSQAIINEDESNYLTGKAQMTKYLPMGVNDTFGGIGLEINSSAIIPGMTTVLRTTGTHLSGNGYQSVDRYFDITPTNNGITGSNIVFHYFDHELNSIAESDLAIYRKRVVGNWQYYGYSARDASLNTITASIDTLGRITAGSILHPLPVELLSFDAKLLNTESALLSWETASETDNDHFDLERSPDGKNFKKIGEVKGKGTSSILHEYEFKDVFGFMTNTILYYRLKQVDYNGHYEYSDIRKLELGSPNHSTFRAWYNSGTEKIQATFYYENPTTASIRVIDMQGKLITEKEMNFPSGTSSLNMDMQGLAQGIYSLSVQDADGLLVKRVLKQ